MTNIFKLQRKTVFDSEKAQCNAVINEVAHTHKSIQVVLDYFTACVMAVGKTGTAELCSLHSRHTEVPL